MTGTDREQDKDRKGKEGMEWRERYLKANEIKAGKMKR